MRHRGNGFLTVRVPLASNIRIKYQMPERRRGWNEREKESARVRCGQQKDALGIIPILLVKLQHHVVSGDAQWASALVVLLLALRLVHVG